jgi:hypothetical protein
MVSMNVLFTIVELEEKKVKQYWIKMSGHAVKRATRPTCVPNGMRQIYDIKPK